MAGKVAMVALWVLLALQATTAYADTPRKVYELKDGNVVVGQVIDEGETAYLVRTAEGATVRVVYDQIERVTVLGGEGSSTDAASDPPASPPRTMSIDSIDNDSAEYATGSLRGFCSYELDVRFQFVFTSPLDAWMVAFFEDNDRISFVTVLEEDKLSIRSRIVDLDSPLTPGTKHEAHIRLENRMVEVHLDGERVAHGMTTDSYDDDECLRVHVGVAPAVKLSDFVVTEIKKD